MYALFQPNLGIMVCKLTPLLDLDILKKCGSLFEQTYIPYVQEYFTPIKIKTSQVVLDKQNQKSMYFRHFEKGIALHLDKCASALCQFCWKFASVPGIQKEMEIQKVYRQMVRRTSNNRRSENVTRTVCSDEL